MVCGISLREAARYMAYALVSSMGAVAAHAKDFPATPGVEMTGDVVTEVFPAKGGPRLIRETGRGEAVFLETAPGVITFTAKSETAERGGISLSFRLEQDAEGVWREVLADSQAAITAAGRITGLADTGSDLISMSGIAGEGRLQLELRHHPHPFGPDGEARDPDDLAEIRFRFDLRAPSQASDGVGSQGESESGNGCRQIQWQLRSSPNIFAGGVDMIRVPVCIP